MISEKVILWYAARGVTVRPSPDGEPNTFYFSGDTLAANVPGHPSPTPADLATISDADAAALSTSLTAMPAQFPTGVAIQDENDPTHWHRIAVVGDTVTPVQISNSPIDPAQWKALFDAKLAERKAELDAREAAITELGLTQQQIDRLKAYLSLTPAQIQTLFGGLSANQQEFLVVTHALLKTLAKREIKEVR